MEGMDVVDVAIRVFFFFGGEGVRFNTDFTYTMIYDIYIYHIYHIYTSKMC